MSLIASLDCLEAMREEAIAAKEEGNRFFRTGELHSAIIAYSRINNQNQRINNRSHLQLPDAFAPTELMDDFIRSPMWMEVCLFPVPNVASLFNLFGQLHRP